jgi:hypothetical protein
MTALDGSLKSLFHLPKAALLPFKRIGFALQKDTFHSSKA